MKKLTNQDPFSNGYEFEMFEDANCNRCIKSSNPTGDGTRYTNSNNGNMPKCSIQRDIVMRMFNNEPIKQETINICHAFSIDGTPCKYLSTEWPKRHKKQPKEQTEITFE